MPERVTIRRTQQVSDGFGGWSEGTPTDVATNVPARIREAQMMSIRGQAHRELQVQRWTVRVPHGTDLQDGDHIVWGTVTIAVDDVKLRSYQTALTVQGETIK